MVGYDSHLSHSLKHSDYAIGGIISGFASRAVVQPMDVLKIRFQLQVEPLSATTVGARYSGILQGFKRIIHEEGSQALWKGHTPAQFQAMLFTFVQFEAFELYTSFLQHISQNSSKNYSSSFPSFSYNFVCGAASGVTASVLSQPFDVLRTRFIAQGEPKVYSSLINATSQMLCKEGVHSFFKGLFPTLLLIGPQTGLQFAVYKLSNNLIDTIRSYFVTNMGTTSRNDNYGLMGSDKSSKTIGPFQSVVAGGIAGSVSKVFVYPLDMVKRRMQVQGFEEARTAFGKLHVSNGFLNCLAVIYKHEGLNGLYKGLQASLLKSFISIAFRFAVYEQFCNFVRITRSNNAL